MLGIKSTSKVNLFLSIFAIVCGVLCLSYCVVNILPSIENNKSFMQIIRIMKGGVSRMKHPISKNILLSVLAVITMFSLFTLIEEGHNFIGNELF